MAFGNIAEAFKMRFGGEDDYEDDYLDEEDDYVDEPRSSRGGGRGAKISAFSAPGRKKAAAPVYDNEVVSVRPRSIDDMNMVSQTLMDEKIVILNTEECDENLARRALDFACGAISMIEGNFVQLSVRKNNSAVGIYALSARNVNITGSYEDQLMSES